MTCTAVRWRTYGEGIPGCNIPRPKTKLKKTHTKDFCIHDDIEDFYVIYAPV